MLFGMASYIAYDKGYLNFIFYTSGKYGFELTVDFKGKTTKEVIYENFNP